MYLFERNSDREGRQRQNVSNPNKLIIFHRHNLQLVVSINCKYKFPCTIQQIQMQMLLRFKIMNALTVEKERVRQTQCISVCLHNPTLFCKIRTTNTDYIYMSQHYLVLLYLSKSRQTMVKSNRSLTFCYCSADGAVGLAWLSTLSTAMGIKQFAP